jgi:hypothetical protein
MYSQSNGTTGQNNAQQRRMAMRKVLTTFIVMAMLAGCMMLVYANSAAPRILPDQNQVLFREDTGISLLHETLVIEWNPQSLTATFRVRYQLQNTTGDLQSLTMWFLSGNYEDYSFKVLINGREIQVKDIEPDNYHFANWEAQRDQPFVTPLNETSLEGLQYYGSTGSPARVTEWQLEMAPGEQAEIDFRYEGNSGYLNHSDYFSQYRTLYYALSPARFFQGEAMADIELQVPAHWIVGANLPFDKISPTQYKLTDYRIQQDDLYLTLLNRQELMFGLNSRSRLFLWTWPIALILAITAFVFRRRKVIWIPVAAASVAVLGINLAKPSYGMMFLMIFLLPIVGLILLSIVVGVYLYRRHLNKKMVPDNGRETNEKTK